MQATTPAFTCAPDLIAELRKARVFWLGAVTFEDRSIASLQLLRRENVHLSGGIAIDYETAFEAQKDAERQRRQHQWQELEAIAPHLTDRGLQRHSAEPYVFDELRLLLEQIFYDGGFDRLVIDISCLTNIHALAAGAVVASLRRWQHCIFIHTAPANYGFIDDDRVDRVAWRDILIAPLAETADLFYESHGRGVVLLGPEVERLVVAITEIEPAGGVAVAPRFDGRPDLGYFIRSKNQRMVRQLTGLPGKSWREKAIGATDLPPLAAVVREEIRRARGKRAPTILFPFGPKTLTLASAFLLARDYPEAAWFVYPIPRTHDVDVTYGVEEIVAFGLTDV